MKNYYIFKSGRLSRKDNSIMFNFMENKKNAHIPIPVTDIDCIYIFGEIDLNSHLFHFLSKHNIMLHFFNYYGWYTGTFYPKEFLLSGDVIIRQAACYINEEERIFLAKQFVTGAVNGIIKNIKRYNDKIENQLKKIIALNSNIKKQGSISSLMGIEGNVRDLYYKSFKSIIKPKIEFTKRVKNPPDNMMNALISFVNSLVYTEVLKHLYKTQLNPTISYLHEPSSRRFSLSLDVSEIFKPIFGDRVMFSLLNNKTLSKKHFDKDVNFAYLNEAGRKIVVKAFDEKLNTTIYHKSLKRKVSFRKLIYLELMKLIKHILEEKKYKSLRMWW